MDPKKREEYVWVSSLERVRRVRLNRYLPKLSVFWNDDASGKGSGNRNQPSEKNRNSPSYLGKEMGYGISGKRKVSVKPRRCSDPRAPSCSRLAIGICRARKPITSR